MRINRHVCLVPRDGELEMTFSVPRLRQNCRIASGSAVIRGSIDRHGRRVAVSDLLMHDEFRDDLTVVVDGNGHRHSDGRGQ